MVCNGSSESGVAPLGQGMSFRAPVRLQTLGLQTLRNHAATRLQPGNAPFVVLTGSNGAGKTNILEAVSLLAVGRGLRGAALREIACQGGAGGFQLAATLSVDPALPPITVHSGTSADAPDRRTLRINGAPAALNTLSDWLSVLWLTPAMDRLFADTASARRRFLDRLVLALSPSHAGHASRYEAAMRARTRLLTADDPADPAWLAALEAQMAEHGAALAAARSETVMALAERLRMLPQSAFPRPDIALSGEPPDIDLADALRSARAADRAAGRATRGPHRTDLAVTHAEKSMPAALASTGEQKALLTAIILAHAELVAERTGRAPLLLLDEAAAHLDASRRAALFDRLAALGGQSWLSGTDFALFSAIADAARFTVADGSATPA